MGNTPTCVGKTRLCIMLNAVVWKHPHVRGEDLLGLGLFGYLDETPPRAWGRPFSTCRPSAAMRNTPTCVGKTPAGATAEDFEEKHPHVRGEDWAVQPL